MSAAVVLDGLTKRFGAFVAVDGITLDVQQGEIFGFLGANGAGKSTTIRMMCGLLRPTGGVARVLGIDVAKDPEAVKRSIGYMSQRFSLYEDLTARQNLRFFGGVYGLTGAVAREREEWAIGMTGLRGQEDVFLPERPNDVSRQLRRDARAAARSEKSARAGGLRAIHLPEDDSTEKQMLDDAGPLAEDSGTDLETFAIYRPCRAAAAVHRGLHVKDRDSSNHPGYATERGWVHASAGTGFRVAPANSGSMGRTGGHLASPFGII